MTAGARQRFAAVAGAGVFLLALLGCLVVATPAAALLYALVAGLVGGGAGWAVVTLVSGGADDGPVTTGRRVDRMATEPVEAPEPPASASPPPDPGLIPPPFVPGDTGGVGPSPHDTARLAPGDLNKVTDLHQTIRLDADVLQYALPDVSAEDILREREGIDEAFLKAGAGIEESGPASENVGGGAPA